ncbi:MAG: hypothetical protein K2O32_10670 [Acetatifactor sp.]|nr:hypothetical protein [Acetatifactor sp.]
MCYRIEDSCRGDNAVIRRISGQGFPLVIAFPMELTIVKKNKERDFMGKRSTPLKNMCLPTRVR